MDQDLALEILLEGHSVFLTGPAGSGKTYLLNKFISEARADGKNVAITATTGLAATHLGGNTIHAWSGIGVYDDIPKYFYDNLTKARLETVQKADVLIIDEVSMLHDFRLDMINEVLQKIRISNEPFGGLQVILCGDFFQLPPVNRADSKQGSFIIDSNVWQELEPVICYLQTQYRQNDDEYLGVLNAIRSGDIRRRHLNSLLARQNQSIGEFTELYTTNIDVDKINHRKLDELESEEHIYDMETSGKANYVESLKRSCLADESLRLKKHALIMFIKNSPDKKYVNGSLGEVVDFEALTNYPIVKLKNGNKITVKPDTWELRDGDKKRASLVQLPIRLAWAITVHKSQGMTLDGAHIDLSKAFVEGMGYVALSRVRSLDDLNILGINATAFKVSPRAIDIDEQLRSKSSKDAKRFEYLKPRIIQRKNKPKVKLKKTDKKQSWNEKLEKMRKEYPNAYKPWTASDDEELVKVFTKNKQVDLSELTKIFGRHPGSIKIRLKKHFGEDAVI